MASHACPFAVIRIFWFLLRGLSGMVNSASSWRRSCSTARSKCPLRLDLSPRAGKDSPKPLARSLTVTCPKSKFQIVHQSKNVCKRLSAFNCCLELWASGLYLVVRVFQMSDSKVEKIEYQVVLCHPLPHNFPNTTVTTSED